MKLGCYIVDDESMSIKSTMEYVGRHDDLYLIGYEKDPFVAAKKILDGTLKPDISFLDIEMAGMDGIELGELVSPFTSIIFTTGHRNYALEAYQLGAADYLLKPYPYKRFLEAIEKAKRHRAVIHPAPDTIRNFIFVRDVMSRKLLRINECDIRYIEGNGNFVNIHAKGFDKPIMSNMTMMDVVGRAASQQFVRIHRKHIINLAHFENLSGNMVTMSDHNRLLLSRRLRNDFLNQLGMDGGA